MDGRTHDSNPTNDTAADAAAVQNECLRRMTPMERLRAGCRMSQRGRRLALDAIRRLHPDADDREVRFRAIELAYGPELAAAVRRWVRSCGR